MKYLQVLALLVAGALSGALVMRFWQRPRTYPRPPSTNSAQRRAPAPTPARVAPSIDSESAARTTLAAASVPTAPPSPPPSPEIKPRAPRRRAPVTTTRKMEATRRPKTASVARSRPAVRSSSFLSLFEPGPAFDDTGLVHGATRGSTFRTPAFFVIVQTCTAFPFFRIIAGDLASGDPDLSGGTEARARKAVLRRALAGQGRKAGCCLCPADQSPEIMPRARFRSASNN